MHATSIVILLIYLLVALFASMLTLLVYRRFRKGMVLYFLLIQFCVGIYVVLEYAAFLLGETVFRWSMLESFMRVLIYLMIIRFLGGLDPAKPSRLPSVVRRVTASVITSGLILCVVVAEFPSLPMGRDGRYLAILCHVGLLWYSMKLAWCSIGRIKDRGVDAMLRAYLVVGPLHLLVRIARDSGLVFSAGGTDPLFLLMHTIPLLIWALAWLLYLISRLEFRPIPFVPRPRVDASPADAFHISARELEIISLLVRGLSRREIGAVLYISEKTVKTHIRNIYGKLGVHNRAALYGFFENRRDFEKYAERSIVSQERPE